MSITENEQKIRLKLKFRNSKTSNGQNVKGSNIPRISNFQKLLPLNRIFMVFRLIEIQITSRFELH